MNVAELLARRLGELGVRRIFGSPLADMTHMSLDDPDLAVLLADADGRIGEVDGRGRLGAALIAGPILHLSSQPGGTAPLQEIGSAEELLDALVDPPGLLTPGTSALHLDLDLTAPVPDDLIASAEPQRSPVFMLDPSLADLDILCIVGPGVVRAGALDGLKTFSRSAGCGVLNSWGAKGVERWDSPWHFGTAGLQERDLELGGVASVDMVIVSGVDPAELPGGRVAHHVVQDVSPGQLGALTTRWPAPLDPPAERTALYGAIAAVVQPLYTDDSVPLTAARAALHLSGALPDGAMAVADAGMAGFWIARTFPTSIPNSVCVPSIATPGFAAAAALVCRLDGRPVLAVTDLDGVEAPETEALVEVADAVGAAFGLQVWERTSHSAWSSSSQHVELLEQHLATDQCRVDPVPIDFSGVTDLESTCGPVVAWGGIRSK